MARGKGAPVFLEWIRRRLALDLGHRFFDGVDCVVPYQLQESVIRPFVALQMLLGHLQAITALRGLFMFDTNITGVIVFAMAAQAQQLRHHHLRPVIARREKYQKAASPKWLAA